MMRGTYPEQAILLIDDEVAWLQGLTAMLKVSEGIDNLVCCSDSRRVMSLLEQQSFGLILLDLTMPYLSGEELLLQISERYPELPIIIVSGHNEIETAVRCVKMGALDFLVKSDSQQRLLSGIVQGLKQARAQVENRRLREGLLSDKAVEHPAFSTMATQNGTMKMLFKYLLAIAVSHEPVLIAGESGVGKEVIARILHKLSGPNSPWVAVNVAGLDDMVFSDTLFGHVKGAFTGADQVRPGMVEKAQNGLLFLDEIGDLTMASQVKLLRLLQEGEYYPLGSDSPKKLRARILVATNQDLEAKERAGEFRRDLLYRLWAHRIFIPPLRERTEDLQLLVEKFLREAAESMGKSVPTLPDELFTLLKIHDFPGNVRELRAMVFDAVSRHQGGVLSTESFRGKIFPSLAGNDKSSTVKENVFFTGKLPTLRQVNQLLIETALEKSQNNQSIAAKILGISPQALSKRLKNNII